MKKEHSDYKTVKTLITKIKKNSEGLRESQENTPKTEEIKPKELKM